jgi:Flp pilus assembly protein TadG
MKPLTRYHYRPAWRGVRRATLPSDAGSTFPSLIRRARRSKVRAHSEEGQAIVEFAFVFSLLGLILVGIINFGITFYNQIALTNASNNAAQVVMAGAGVITDPCASANTAFASAAPNLNNSKIYGSNPLSFSITAYTSATASTTVGPYQVVFSGSGGPSCTGEAASLTPGQQVVVTATYGCNLTIFGHNFAPSCKLSATTSEAVQ